MSDMNTGKAKVLIVDDDAMIVELMAQSLSDYFDISFALTAKDALTIAASHPQPDLILLDVILPDMKGDDVCRILKSKSETYNIPVIFVTSKSEVKDKTRGFELGAVDFVTKPIELPVLKARVKTHINLKRYVEKLEELSLTDPLTDLANKRQYANTLDNEWSRACRAQEQLSLMIIDVDDFKKFNDNYGHGAGDDCLMFIAATLRCCVSRAADLVARVGGEEFAVLMPGTDEAGAKAIASSILQKLMEKHYPHQYSSVAEHVTVSIGIATLTPSEKHPAQALFDKADEALYRAKEKGKNQYQCR